MELEYSNAYLSALRKRANRRIAALWKAGYSNQAQFFGSLLLKTYKDNYTPDEVRKAAIKDLEKVAVQAPSTRIERQNAMFRRELSLASKGFETSLGAQGASKVKMFWAATRNIWVNKPNEEREATVLKYLGVNSLKEAYDKVMTQQVQAYAEVLGKENAGWTDESPAFLEAISESSDNGVTTPTYQSVRNK